MLTDKNSNEPTIEEQYSDNDISPEAGYYLGMRSDDVLEAFDATQQGVCEVESGDVWPTDGSLSEYVAQTHTDWCYEDVSELGYAMLVADELAEASLLTRAQAEVYALREIAGFDRLKTSSLLQISESGVDKHLRAARDKIKSAEETISVLEGLEQVEKNPDHLLVTEYLSSARNQDASEPAAVQYAVDRDRNYEFSEYTVLESDPDEYEAVCECGQSFGSWSAALTHVSDNH